MGMRLLSPLQGKSRRDTEIQLQDQRIIELDRLLEQKRLEIQALDKSFVKTLSEKGVEHYEEEQKWKAKIGFLSEEVTQLEERRKRALVPLEEREKEIDTRNSALLQREEKIVIKESDLAYTQKALEDRLDAISEREQDASDYAIKLNNREFAIQFKEKQTEERSAALVMILQEEFDRISKSQAEMARQKAVLKGREISLLEREKSVEMREKSFANRELAILDKYRTLQKAITETNLKQNVSKQNTARDAS